MNFYSQKLTKEHSKMNCPYFKKINFQKIDQLITTQQQQQKTIQQLSKNKDILIIEDLIPEEGSTNLIKVQSYKKINRYALKEDIYYHDQIITIKMPKNFQIKSFNIPDKQVHSNTSTKAGTRNKQNTDLNIQNEHKNRYIEQIQQISQQFNYQQRQNTHPKSARVFQTNKSIFIQSSFYSIVYLIKQKLNCFCHLNGTIFKIITIPETILNQISSSKLSTNYTSTFQIKNHTQATYQYPNIRVKYFVQLTKYKLQLHELGSTILQITLFSKGSKQKVNIQFVNQFQRHSFQCVYESIMKLIIKQKQNIFTQRKLPTKNAIGKSSLAQLQTLQQNQQQLSIYQLQTDRSIDSLKFTVQRIKYKQCLSLLTTFDIILFKGKNIISKVQRFITNSDFDHVGLIIKTSNGNLLLLQATGNVGVAIYAFQSIYKALEKKIYDRVAIRKYIQNKSFTNAQRAKKFIELQEFVSHVIGKKYKFDPMYLITNTDKTKKKVSQSSNKQQLVQQTYFCSQLVAEALKKCKIMKKTKPSYKFLPKHFGETQGLNRQLNEGHYYSNLIVLQY